MTNATNPTVIAALFVQRNGVYFNLPGVDPWDEARDARNYRGPRPVVAHPPCQLWINFACLNYKRYGGEHNRPGNDGGCFASALASVRAYGGVLEHPAYSRAFAAFRLPRPTRGGWTQVGDVWVCSVDQSNYGHRARKRTWLIYCGQKSPPDLDWADTPGTHQCGWFDRNKPTLSKRWSNATPAPFRDLLVELARNCGGPPR